MSDEEQADLLVRVSDLEREVEALRRTVTGLAKESGMKIPPKRHYETAEDYGRMSESLGIRRTKKTKDD